VGLDTFLANPQAVASVKAMLASESVPGALLFTGPDGVGKKTLALGLAKALNCERMKGDYCGSCRSCRKCDEMVALAHDDLARRRAAKDAARRVDGLTYFDVQLIEPLTRFILTEQIRQLRSVAYTRPFELRHRVFILDQPQAIHWQAADLLLKVLEEPPESSRFVLVCPNPHELRPTLRSRCQRVPFQPASDAVVEGLLRAGKQVPVTQLKLATRIVSGSIVAAKNFNLEQFQAQRKPWVAFLNAVTAKGTRAFSSTDWKDLFDSTKALSEDRSNLESTLRLGYTLLSDMLRVLENHAAAVVNLDLAARLEVWSGQLGLAGIERLKNGLDSAYRLQTRNVNQQLAWDAVATDIVMHDG
jgi:DNA polymerase III subunit delta'